MSLNGSNSSDEKVIFDARLHSKTLSQTGSENYLYRGVSTLINKGKIKVRNYLEDIGRKKGTGEAIKWTVIKIIEVKIKEYTQNPELLVNFISKFFGR